MPKILDEDDIKFICKEVDFIKEEIKKDGFSMSGNGADISQNIGIYLSIDKNYEVIIRELKA